MHLARHACLTGYLSLVAAVHGGRWRLLALARAIEVEVVGLHQSVRIVMWLHGQVWCTTVAYLSMYRLLLLLLQLVLLVLTGVLALMLLIWL